MTQYARYPTVALSGTVTISGTVAVSNFPAVQAVSIAGRPGAQLIRNDYSSTNVTNAAYVTLVASTVAAINTLIVFDSSGAALKIAVGAIGFEVDKFYVFPGGVTTAIELNIPIGSRLSIESVDTATVSIGQLLITALG